ncbi:MAG: phosphoribosylaminoimidazolesuccinocarboxamide synthase [Parcubacteria group bacterium]|nr:phosphoribosylaminoimidazolesuccinocarboxamide synthase [Parcubacteria group bacterium]
MISRDVIRAQLGNCLEDAWFRWTTHYTRGKVRDMYPLPASQDMPERRVIIATDRQSAHDHIVGTIPFYGQVRNQIALWWFSRTDDIVPNAVLAAPDENVVVMEELIMFPVEMVVRACLTGSSSTAIWTHYNNGERIFCGHRLPDGMVKNQPLPMGSIITPSTKAEDGHDKSISDEEVLAHGLVDPDTWDQLAAMALALFARGQKLAEERGLILVDTKYEFGETADGLIMIADEIHTPDSSRYWVRATYEERLRRDEEPESLDKEPLRIWLKEQGISDDHVPELTDDIRIEMAQRYIALFERITGETFVPPDADMSIRERIEEAITPFMF